VKLQKRNGNQWSQLTVSSQLLAALFLACLNKNPDEIFVDSWHTQQKIGFRTKKIYDDGGFLLRIEVTPFLVTPGEPDEVLMLSLHGISFPILAIITPVEPDSECIICFEKIKQGGDEIVKTPCGHFYHRECIGGWLTRGNVSCPMCRNPVEYLLPVPV
jgi:hypothetical protein